MAIAQVGTWSTEAVGDPTGTLTIGAGANRIFVLALTNESSDAWAPTGLQVGGVTYDEIYHDVYDAFSDSNNVFYIWDEASIASMTGSAVSNYTHTGTDTGQQWQYATFSGVRQVTPVVKTTSQVASADTLDITTQSTANEYILVLVSRVIAARDVTDWDTLTEVSDTAGSPGQAYRHALGQGVGGDNTTTLTGDGTDGAFLATGLVLQEAVASVVTVDEVGPANLEIIYDNELRVRVTGTSFEAAQGTGGVQLHDYDPADLEQSGTDVAQIERSWSDTEIVFDVDKGALSGDNLWLSVTNDSGDQGSTPVIVRADPGANVVAERANPANQSFEQDVAFSFDMGPYVFASDVQDELTFTVSGQPSGMTMSSDGVYSGLIADGESGSSPFTVTVTCTDSDGDSVQDVFTHTVSAAITNYPTDGPWNSEEEYLQYKKRLRMRNELVRIRGRTRGT